MVNKSINHNHKQLSESLIKRWKISYSLNCKALDDSKHLTKLC